MSSRSSEKPPSMLHSAKSKETCASEPEPSPAPRPPVAPKGDVILVVGPTAHEIRVHALILSNASPVFAAMLQGEGSRYGECAAVRAATSSEPAYILLPEDDPAALEVICRIVHGRTLEGNGEAVWDLAPREILTVAVAVDKYDCAPAMALAIRYWLAPEKMAGMMAAIRDGCIGFRRCDLLLATYWFKTERVFEEVTLRMILDVAAGFEGLVDGREGADEQLAYRLALALETKRNHLRLVLHTVLMDRIHIPFFNYIPTASFIWWNWPRYYPEDEPTSNVLRSIDREVFVRGMPYMSISEAMRRAVEIPAAGYNRVFGLRRKYDDTKPEGKGNRKPFHKKWMEKGVEEFERKRLEGLCLACLHPQMKCEREHKGSKWEKGDREEWSPWVGPRKGGGCLD